MPSVIPSLLLVTTLGLGSAGHSRELPPGWVQIDIASYHGAEGAFFDSVSGALVRYYLGPVPNSVGAVFEREPTTPCWAGGTASAGLPSCGIRIEPKAEGAKAVQVRVHGIAVGDARFWSTVLDDRQLQRVMEVLRPDYALWTRHASGRVYSRSPRAAALQKAPAGSPLEVVLQLVGPATSASLAADGTLVVEFFGLGRARFTSAGTLVEPLSGGVQR